MTSDTDYSFLAPIAESGEISKESLPWPKMCSMMKDRIDLILENEFKKRDNALKDPLTGISRTIEEYAKEVKVQFDDKFPDNPPFTVQRIAELLLKPTQFYSENNPEKFLFALERSLSVQSSCCEFSEEELKAELRNNTNTPITENEPENNQGIVLTQISWVVDTGTPPPDDLSESKKPKENADKNDDLSESKKANESSDKNDDLSESKRANESSDRDDEEAKADS